MTNEDFEICDGCFSYVGGMERDDAVCYFNFLMEEGIYLDPDDAISCMPKSQYSDEFKQRIKERIERAFDEKSPAYGELLFEVVCHDRVTGQFGHEKDFVGRISP